MRLFTVQPLAAVVAIDSGSAYTARWDLCRRDGYAARFAKPYRWMSAQLEAVDKPPLAAARYGCPLLWAWTDTVTTFQQLSCEQLHPCAVFELSIPAGRVLLSDYLKWDDWISDEDHGVQISKERKQDCLNVSPYGYNQAVFWQIKPSDVVRAEVLNVKTA